MPTVQVAGAQVDLVAQAGMNLLANLAARLEALGVDVPARRIFPVGSPVHEIAAALQQGADGCDEHLAVYLAQIDPLVGSTAGKSTQGVSPGGTFGIELVRCVGPLTFIGDQGQIPSTDAITADGARFAGDAWALWWVLTRRRNAADLFAPLPSAVGVSIRDVGSVTTVDPSGLVAGVATTVRFQLEGILT